MFKFVRGVGFLCLAAFPLALFAQQSTTPPKAANLPALKAEAVAEIDKMQTLTQQMVDQVFSFSELGFQEIETSRYLTDLVASSGSVRVLSHPSLSLSPSGSRKRWSGTWWTRPGRCVGRRRALPGGRT